MKDAEMDEILKKAAAAPHKVDSALLDRVAGSIQATLKPVRPLPPTWVLTTGLILICAIVGLAGAARAGFFGIEKMDLLQRVLIFSTLAILVWLAGEEFTSELIPGSRHRMTPGVLLGIGCLALTAVFAFIFRDYHIEHFVSAGFTCLFTGVLHAIPASILSWLVLRRGFAVNAISAGLAGGALAGLTGVTLLELHCANFQAFHILVWHTAVVPVTAALGAAVPWMLQRNRLAS